MSEGDRFIGMSYAEIAGKVARDRGPLFAMSFDGLRAANMSRCSRWHPRGLNEWSLSDWFTATMGELGEAANIAKKLNRERDGIAGNTVPEEQLRAELADEIADVAIYLDILAASEGIDLQRAIAAKFNKTSEKVGFPERLHCRCEKCGVAFGSHHYSECDQLPRLPRASECGPVLRDRDGSGEAGETAQQARPEGQQPGPCEDTASPDLNRHSPTPERKG